jgi:hypothetical protein
VIQLIDLDQINLDEKNLREQRERERNRIRETREKKLFIRLQKGAISFCQNVERFVKSHQIFC